MAEEYTSYAEVNKKLTYLIDGSSYLDYTPYEIEEIFSNFLSYACMLYETSEKDLSDRDDELKRFNIKLTDSEQWILAHGMTICWLKPKINYEENMAIAVGDRDYSPTSSANHIDKLLKMLQYSTDEFERLTIGHSYSSGNISELAR